MKKIVTFAAFTLMVFLLAGCFSTSSLAKGLGVAVPVSAPSARTNYLEGKNPYYTGDGEKLGLTAADIKAFAKHYDELETVWEASETNGYTDIEQCNADLNRLGISGPNEFEKVLAIYQGSAYIAILESMYKDVNPVERAMYITVYGDPEDQFGAYIANIHPDDMAVIEENYGILRPVVEN